MRWFSTAKQYLPLFRVVQLALVFTVLVWILWTAMNPPMSLSAQEAETPEPSDSIPIPVEQGAYDAGAVSPLDPALTPATSDDLPQDSANALDDSTQPLEISNANGQIVFVGLDGLLYLIDPRNSSASPVQLGDFENVNTPMWSHDGVRLAFSARGSNDTRCLYVFDLRTFQPQELLCGFDTLLYPFWSPDENRFVFYGHRSGGADRAWTVEIDDTSTLQEIRADIEQALYPVWLDNEHIVFPAKDPSARIWAVHVANVSTPTQSQPLPGNFQCPSGCSCNPASAPLMAYPDVSPDGSKIGFIGLRHKGSCSFAATVYQTTPGSSEDPTPKADVAGGNGAYGWLRWAPDNRHAALIATGNDSAGHIQVIDMASNLGSDNIRTFAPRTPVPNRLEWAPDGSYLIVGYGPSSGDSTVYTVDPADGTFISLIKGKTPDWGIFNQELYHSISGRVTDAGGNPIPEVLVWSTTGLTTTTSSDGSYLLDGLLVGEHILTASKDGFTFSPPTRTISLPPDATGQDFTGILQSPMIGTFYNLGAKAGGTIDLALALQPIEASGYVNFTERPEDPSPLCGAGHFSGPRNGEKLSLSFTSSDPDPGCGFDHGAIFTMTTTLDQETTHLWGNYLARNADGSHLAESPGVLEVWTENNQPRQILYTGRFTNTNVQAGGPVTIEISIGTSTVSGFLNFTNDPNIVILCGAGNFTGVKEENTLQFSFISHDPDSGCGFDRGGKFVIDATLSESGASIIGFYSDGAGRKLGEFHATTDEDTECRLVNFGDANGNPLMQTDPIWAKVPYGGYIDTEAGKFYPFIWSGIGVDNIDRWGCTMTSAAMIVNYFAQKQGVPFQTDPLKLNEWLQRNEGYRHYDPIPDASKVKLWAQHPDNKDYVMTQVVGDKYVEDAYVKHTKVAEYAREMTKDLSNGPIHIDPYNFPQLGSNDVLVNAAICTGNPVILNVKKPGFDHYVTASGTTSRISFEDLFVHDPLEARTIMLNEKWEGTYYNYNIYKGSPLSAGLLISVNGHNNTTSRWQVDEGSEFQLLVTDNQGRRTGFDPETGSTINEISNSWYGEETLTTSDGTSTIRHNVFGLQETAPAIYDLQVIGEGEYALAVDGVNVAGQIMTLNISGTLSPGESALHRVEYSPDSDAPIRVMELIYLPMVSR